MLEEYKQRKSKEIVDLINKVYRPESEVYKNMQKSLAKKLNRNELGNLYIMIKTTIS